MRRFLPVFAAVLLLALPALAVQPDEVLRDPALEARARAISAELRCLVCQNQSIDDSDAPLARDLRILVRERLSAGDSDEEVRNFVVARYGDFVLLRPPFNWQTALLWGGPFLVLLAGIAAIVTAARRRRTEVAAIAPLSDEEKARLAALLEGRDQDA
ncbi:cytochrome c-type biogenesis protein [Chelatococcus composti]|jgi:cytochrome c-type biogenesis protein CcmH|uniref:Cytochrome c-type biogenesis protein n=1 Tax=Chelatococcus composti TaxID=1743235 RepID=A0A841KBS6_9HYPH|nr:cytochrome c-type biogenesis protein [Chelatococcus composti]MBB6168354.1 cytochrome c-type biogenesis protein CcmH [Chelatococcus composti]MBS7736563.1 cytochrome c-type biogenesis protein CcmH [Chelatococcus composti]PZN41269.1 MAG: cytochrome c-type biogenesis protein CcmH [Pseudomonadota bacterium]GGG39380.1 cytochrome c biogenesis protein [Chelatococcus composti]